MIANTLIRRGRRALLALAMAGIASGALVGCDFLDPTEVDNPRTTDDDLADAQQPTGALLPGLRAQFARALGAVVITTENISDNYSIQGTGLSKELDEPDGLNAAIGTLNATGGTGAYWNLQELRSLADFVLDDIVPEDETATAAQIAEIHYYRGMAFLMQAENYIAVPMEEDGAPVPADQLLSRAIADLDAVETTDPNSIFVLPAWSALARAHRIGSDAAQAESFANLVLATDPGFAFLQEYDATSIENAPHIFLVLRALQEMQPLPRLDFLDPKFTSREAGIVVAKAEEMHLILAEVAMSQGDFAGARTHMANAIELAQDVGLRPVERSFADMDLRKNGDLTVRPRDADIKVRADSASPWRTGLIQNRPGPVDVPTISATSLDADSIRAIPAADEEALIHALYLARQEILFLEGRRMSDLGIRLPMMQREIDANPSISEGDPGTVVSVPAYIPPGDDMDLFDPISPYTGDLDDLARITDEITIKVDMNRILATNRVSPLF